MSTTATSSLSALTQNLVRLDSKYMTKINTNANSILSLDSKVNQLSSAGLKRKTVEALPKLHEATPNTIYMVPNGSDEYPYDNVYDEYIFIHKPMTIDSDITGETGYVSFKLDNKTYTSSDSLDATYSHFENVFAEDDPEIPRWGILYFNVTGSNSMIAIEGDIYYHDETGFAEYFNSVAFGDYGNEFYKYTFDVYPDESTFNTSISVDYLFESIGSTKVDLSSKMDAFGTISETYELRTLHLPDDKAFLFNHEGYGGLLFESIDGIYLNGMNLDFNSANLNISIGGERVIHSHSDTGHEIRISHLLDAINDDDAVNLRTARKLFSSALSYKCIDELPSIFEAENNVIYLIPQSDSTENNEYDEYLLTDTESNITYSNELSLDAFDGYADAIVIFDEEENVINLVETQDPPYSVILSWPTDTFDIGDDGGVYFEGAATLIDGTEVYINANATEDFVSYINSIKSNVTLTALHLTLNDGEFNNKISINQIDYNVNKCFELIGNTEVDLSTKMDKWGTVTSYSNGAGINIASNSDTLIISATENYPTHLKLEYGAGTAELHGISGAVLSGGTDKQLKIGYTNASFASKSGVDMVVTGIATPTNSNDAANRGYVDDKFNSLVTMSLKRTIVDGDLPTSAEADPNTIYMKMSSAEPGNSYDEYLYVAKPDYSVDLTATADIAVSNITNVNVSTDGSSLIITSRAIGINNAVLKIAEIPDANFILGGTFKFEVVGLFGSTTGMPSDTLIEMYLDYGTDLYDLIKTLYETYPNSPNKYLSTGVWSVTDYGGGMIRTSFETGVILDMYQPELIGTSAVDLTNKQDALGQYRDGVLTLNSGDYFKLFQPNIGAYLQMSSLTTTLSDVTLKLIGGPTSITLNPYNGITLSGMDDADRPRIHNLADPQTDYDAANKKYVDDSVNSIKSSALNRQIVDVLPSLDEVDSNTVYMILKSNPDESDVYDEYMYTVISKPVSDIQAVTQLSSSSAMVTPGITKQGLRYTCRLSVNPSDSSQYILYFTSINDTAQTFDVCVSGDSSFTEDQLSALYSIRSYIESQGLAGVYFKIPYNITDTDIRYSIIGYSDIYDYELIGSSKCDLSGYITSETYNTKVTDLENRIVELESVITEFSEKMSELSDVASSEVSE